MDGTIFKHFSAERRARDISPSAACSQASSLVPVSQLASSITAQPCDPCAQVSSVHVCVFVCACHGTGDGVYLHAEEGWWTWAVVFFRLPWHWKHTYKIVCVRVYASFVLARACCTCVIPQSGCSYITSTSRGNVMCRPVAWECTEVFDPVKVCPTQLCAVLFPGAGGLNEAYVVEGL